MLSFGKYHGAGNDFVCVDDRDGAFAPYDNPAAIAALCTRHYGIGADGLVALRTDPTAADGLGLKMVYFNADGQPSSFCGNGSRCFLRFALDLGILTVGDAIDFGANDGLHRGKVCSPDRFSVSMHVRGGVVRIGDRDDKIETGSPHFVRWCAALPKDDIVADARAIRYGAAFAKTGINVNYAAELDRGRLAVRTYERGVEAETQACGTGVTAAVLSFAERRQLTGRQEIGVRALGGELTVGFERNGDGRLSDVTLEGPAAHVFSGEIDVRQLLGATAPETR